MAAATTPDSAGGVTNGRGLAGMYTPLALDDGRLVEHGTLERMRRIRVGTNRESIVDAAYRSVG